MHIEYTVQNARLVHVVVQDKLTNRIANSLLLLSALRSWHRNSADTVPAHQSVGHWVRAQSYRCQHLRHEEVSIRKRSTQHTGRGSERSRRKETYTYICLCRKFPRLSCGDKSTRRHATIESFVGKNNWSTHLDLEPREKKGARRIRIMFTHDMTGNVSETAQNPMSVSVKYARLFFPYFFLHCETYIDQEVTTATGNEKRRSRRKDDSDLRAEKKIKKKFD
jgi:hypothetical protein